MKITHVWLTVGFPSIASFDRSLGDGVNEDPPLDPDDAEEDSEI